MIYLVLLPAAIHLYIFLLESFLWGKPKTNEVFGLRPSDAEVTRSMAFNQGFYNLFLAVEIVVGLVLKTGLVPWEGGAVAGLALLIFGLGSIVAAGLVLLTTSPKLWKSALIQAGPAGLGLAALWL